MGMRPMVFRRC